jgi:hypothetical protein
VGDVESCPVTPALAFAQRARVDGAARAALVRLPAGPVDRIPSQTDEILALQRSAGNRAVTALLRGEQHPVVQRDIPTRVLDLIPARSDPARERAGHGTYSRIVRALSEYQDQRDKGQKLFYADVVIGLSDHWLTTHAASNAPRDVARRPLLTKLLAEAKEEAITLRAEVNHETTNRKAHDVYMSDMGSGGFKGARQFDEGATTPAKQMVQGSDKVDKLAVDLVAKVGLTAAEITAIRLYTLPDYMYINPATANSDDWMAKNVAGAGDEYEFKDVTKKRLKQEGATHAGMVMQGLMKLEPYTQTTFRGERVTPEKFKTKYAKGGTMVSGALTSSTKLPDRARRFADGVGGNKPPEVDQTTSVFAEVEGISGRDISRLSAAPYEEEILFPPGSTFSVVHVINDGLDGPGSPGSPVVPAKEWYTVFLKQIA